MFDKDYIQIDALTCKKRFHCRFDRSSSKLKKATFYCPECHALLWEKENSYPVHYLRNENLINEENISLHHSYQCNQFDKPIQS